MLKIFNTKGLLMVAGVLIVSHFATALIVSPILGKMIINALNKAANQKISVEKINVWPLTMTLTANKIKIFDPDNSEMRMVLIDHTSARLSVIGLLSKRIIFSGLTLSGAEIDLQGEKDGTFNIEKLAKGDKSVPATEKKSIFDQFKGKKDWFSKIYEMIKSSASKKASEEKKEKAKAEKTVKKEVSTLPKGRLVRFTRPGDDYFLQVRNFSIKNSAIAITTSDGEKITISKAGVNIKNLAIDPLRGTRFSYFDIKGNLEKDETSAGTFDLRYIQHMRADALITELDLSAKDVDLAATSFLYKDSLPVNFTSGEVSLSSHNGIIDGELNSKNSITMINHIIVPKSGSTLSFSIIPTSTLCDALNKVSPLKLEFGISGTLEKPKFEGFEKAIMEVVRPYINNVVQNVKDKGMKAITDMFKKATGEE